MSIYKDIKRAVSSTVNMVVDKTATGAQKSRLVTVMRTESKNIDLLYIQLGQYLYNNLRDTMPEDIVRTCCLIDESKERMSRAQTKYREVIQQEIVNRDINRAEAKENFVRIKEPIVAKAKDTAALVKDKAVDTAGKMKTDTAAKVEEIKKAAAERKLNRVKNEGGEENDQPDNDTAEIGENIIDVEEEAAVNEAINEAIDDNADACTEEATPSEIAGSETETEIEVPAAEQEETPASEAAEAADDSTPDDKPLDQEFQRSVPVDIISETEFEEDEPEIKPIEKSNPIAKAMKLRNIISKKDSSEE